MSERIDKMIDKALRSEPSFELSQNFKQHVVEVIRRKEKSRQRRLYFWIALGVITICGFGYGVISYFMPSFFNELEMSQGFEKLNRFIPLAILTGVIISIIQYLDKKLIKDRFFTH